MRKFDVSFRNDLRKKVETVETDSGAELVVAILPRTALYLEYYLGVGIAAAFIVLTTMMFIPKEIWYVYIYFETVGLGIFAGGMLWLIPSLLRFVVGKKQLQRKTENRCNAIFQKARIYETRQRVGILLTFCWLERIAVLMPDKGVAEMVPPDALEGLLAKCNAVFKTEDPAQAILNALDETRDLLSRYIPADAHPINELPDELWIE